MNRWRVGEDTGSKETDGCPLTVGQGGLSMLLAMGWVRYGAHYMHVCTQYCHVLRGSHGVVVVVVVMVVKDE
jgi:hypothetical protein